MFKCIRRLLTKEKVKNNVVRKIIGDVEVSRPRALVELHEIVDNRYWVGYEQRGREIIEEIEKCLGE